MTVSSRLFHLNYLALLQVAGKDSANFLQGQLSCNIHSLADNQACLGVLCNAKGRVISLLIVFKTAEAFFLVMPNSLQNLVLQKLQRYILRAEVKIHKPPAELWVMGAYTPSNQAAYFQLPGELPRFMWLTALPHADKICGDTAEWQYQDLLTGLTWFDSDQAELYTPQMLNLDQLGAISFNKGCYTGQEIIARTHYLGKAKRSLFFATASGLEGIPAVGTQVVDMLTQQTVGSVLQVAVWGDQLGLLLVLLSTELESTQWALADAENTPLTIMAFI
jgi:folate-binding protein YgfZ